MDFSLLTTALKNELPGLTSQVKMTTTKGVELITPSNNAYPAAVLILLYPSDHGLSICLMKRKQSKDDRHSGQISLPGGRYEKYDLTLENCALREADEELGIKRDKVTMLGQLTDLYVFASNHMVYPFVGYTDQRPDFTLEKSEVAQLIEEPMSHLLDSSTVKNIDMIFRNMPIKNVPYYDVKGEVVWGATAMILSEFLEIWRNSEQSLV